MVFCSCCRRSEYTVRNYSGRSSHPNGQTMNMDSVDHVYIHDIGSIANCKKKFVNAEKLIFTFGCGSAIEKIQYTLTNIVSLKKLTILDLEYAPISLMDLIHLLNCAPNIHTLMYSPPRDDEVKSVEIQQNDSFRSVSSTNKITDLKIGGSGGIRFLDVFLVLCPKIEQLRIDSWLNPKWLESLVRLLQFKTNTNSKHLSLLHIINTCTSTYEGLKKFILTEGLLNYYSLKQVEREVYIWW